MRFFLKSALLAATAVTIVGGTLPANAGTAVYTPGNAVPSFAVPLFGNTTLDPASRTFQPLVIAALDSADPFVKHMLFAEDSLAGFLASMNGSAHYLFTAYNGDGSLILQLKQAMALLLSKQPPAIQQQWEGRLHFTNGTVSENASGESVLGPDLTAALAQWKTPRNMLVPSEGYSFPRLDCKYASCPWPDQNGAFALVANRGSGPCTPSNVTVPHAYILIKLAAGSSCTAEAAAAAAAKAGAAGVLVAAAAPGQLLVPVAGAPIYAAMIDSAAGDALTASLAAPGTTNLTLTYASLDRAGELIAVDSRGKLQEVGWEKYSDARMLSWGGQFLDYSTKRDAQLRAPALVVPVFDQAISGTVVTVKLPPQALLAQFPSVELDFALECQYGNMDKACSVWDRIVSVGAVCSTEEDGGNESGARDVPVAFELGRWINAFQRRVGRWVTRTPVLSGLGGATCNFTFELGMGDPWRATLNVRFSTLAVSSSQLYADTSSTELIVYPNPSQGFSGPAYNVNKTVTFTPPPGTKRVVVAAIITGHGGCEFQPTSHHYIVNGNNASYYNTSTAQYYDRYMLAGTDFGCADKTYRGAVPNEHGTWYFGRNGWCDGLDVEPLLFDITADVNLGSNSASDGKGRGAATSTVGGIENTLQYYALAYPNPGMKSGGTEAGCAGTITMSSYLVYY